MRLFRKNRFDLANALSLDDYPGFRATSCEALSGMFGVSDEDCRSLLQSVPLPPGDPNEQYRAWNAAEGLLATFGAIIRLTKPQIVVETGVAHGYSSTVALEILKDNQEGVLHSVDFPAPHIDVASFVGSAVPTDLKDRWTLHLGPSRLVLPRLLERVEPVDIFLHDSDHSYGSQLEDYRTAWPHLRSGGVLLSDDVRNTAFIEFAAEVGQRPYLIPQTVKPPFGLLRKDE
jgi:predicted O-methyltransferase YrrM